MEGICNKEGKVCANNDERRQRYLAAKHRYNTKKYLCVECGKELTINNRSIHQRSKIHNLNKKLYTFQLNYFKDFTNSCK